MAGFEGGMREESRNARVFRNGRNQAVRIPRAMEFAGKSVFVTKRGEELVISARPSDWTGLLESTAVASQGFLMRGRG